MTEHKITTEKKQMRSDSFLKCLNSIFPGWVDEHRFCPGRMWRFDYANPDRMLAIEIEGAIFANGRHSRGSGMAGDMEKYNKAELYGWTILRYPAQPYQYISKISKEETEASRKRREDWANTIRKEVKEFLSGVVDGQKTLSEPIQSYLLSEVV